MKEKLKMPYDLSKKKLNMFDDVTSFTVIFRNKIYRKLNVCIFEDYHSLYVVPSCRRYHISLLPTKTCSPINIPRRQIVYNLIKKQIPGIVSGVEDVRNPIHILWV